MNVTSPDGAPAPTSAAVTVAVKVTICWKSVGLSGVARVVLVPSCTTCGAASPLLSCQPLVPIKLALMVWLPAPSDGVLNEASPVASTAIPEGFV